MNEVTTKPLITHNGKDYEVSTDEGDALFTNVKDTDDRLILVGGATYLKHTKLEGQNISYEDWIRDELFGYAFEHVSEAQLLEP